MRQVKSLDTALIISSVLFLAFCTIAIAFDQYLYADGAHFLLEILVRDNIYTPIWSRIGANTVKELLPLILIKIGVTDITIIGKSFGLNYYLAPFIGTFISYLMVRRTRPELFLFPFLSFVYILVNHYAYLSVESIYAVSAFWPVYLHLLHDEKVDSKLLLTIIGLVVLGSSYELTVILYPFIFWSLMIAYRKKRYDSAIGFLVILITSTAGFLYSFYWGLHPENTTLITNRADLLNSMKGMISNVVLYLFAGAVVLWITLGAKRNWNKKLFIAIQLVFFISLVFLTMTPLLRISSAEHPGVQWHLRMMVLISALVFACLHFYMYQLKKWHFHIMPEHFLAFSMAAMIFQFQLTWGWSRFIGTFEKALVENTKVITLNELRIQNESAVNRYAWSWSNPTISVLLEAMNGDTINTIVENDPVKWLPWNHYQKTSLFPDLSSYGKVYDQKALEYLSDSTYIYQIGY